MQKEREPQGERQSARCDFEGSIRFPDSLQGTDCFRMVSPASSVAPRYEQARTEQAMELFIVQVQNYSCADAQLSTDCLTILKRSS